MIRGAGSYYDGESAVRREVTIDVTPDGLRILESSGHRELAFWEYRELRPVDDVPGDGPCRIRAEHGSARLVLTDRSLIADITAHAPRLATRERGWASLCLRWAGLLTVSIAVLLAALWFGLPRFADHAARLVPNEWEVDLGESLVEPVVRQLARFDGTETAAFCTASRGREVLEALSRRLAPAESPYRFQVRVVNLKMNNAFALPGGQVVIAQGFLRFAESPDEVAGVLAHEMGHVIHRHTTAAVIEALGLAFLFGVMFGDLGTGAIGWAGETLIGLSFRREAEAEADESAIELLGRAGLSSQGLADFFERIERQTSDMPAFLHPLSTHPRNESRRRSFARGVTAGPPSLGEREWRSLQGICSRQEPLEPW